MEEDEEKVGEGEQKVGEGVLATYTNPKLYAQLQPTIYYSVSL